MKFVVGHLGGAGLELFFVEAPDVAGAWAVARATFEYATSEVPQLHPPEELRMYPEWGQISCLCHEDFILGIDGKLDLLRRQVKKWAIKDVIDGHADDANSQIERLWRGLNGLGPSPRLEINLKRE